MDGLVDSAGYSQGIDRATIGHCLSWAPSRGRGAEAVGDVKVGIIMGSQSDWKTMRNAADVLDELGVRWEARLVSAHRTPDRLWEYATTAPGARPTCPA
jgi:hypothetical protein